MRHKRIRTRLFNVWLHPRELEFLNNYAEENMFTASEVIRALIHQLMGRKGYEIKEPLLPETKIKSRRK